MKACNWCNTMTSIGSALGLAALLFGCGSSGGGGDTASTSVDLSPPAARTVVGQIDEVDDVVARAARAPAAGTTITLDDGTVDCPLDGQGRFEVTDLVDGDHSLFITSASGATVEVPIRMLDGRGLDLGTVSIRNGQLDDITGADGYRYGFVDTNGDGLNDNCVDAQGDGICDEGCRYANYTYLMNWGYVDEDGDGKNDRYQDRDGDGINDLDGTPNGMGFGFVDADEDGINDNFRDANGDGICDQTGMPYRVNQNWVDEDGDGINDKFQDADGDRVNDVDGIPYVAMPGWVDLDGDGVNDKFQDANGDGICDNTGLSYGHGFGFVDDDGDGINDNCTDGNGNGVCDCADGDGDGACDGRYAQQHYRYGFLGPHVIQDGEPVGTGNGLRDGFGWVDGDGDGENDVSADEDQDGVNDQTGTDYTNGYQQDEDWEAPAEGPPVEWPPCDDDFTRPPAARGLKGAVVFQDDREPPQGQTDGATITVTLDNVDGSWPLDSHGRFELTGILDGDHSLFVTSASGVVVEVPFRMLGGKGLNLGTVTLRDGAVEAMTGFDGYLPGFLDENEDGINDNCTDRAGNGICDAGSRYANYTYLMNWGYVDEDGDGINDRFRDGNGDGVNDLNGTPNGWGFGFVDENDDGINDKCTDANGNGICDQSGMPYRVRAMWRDVDHDGVNDTFADADGDGINDVTGRPYVAMPGWQDREAPYQHNDFFADADGDGICDKTGVGYAHGFGYVDEDGDGINDNFHDDDGDGINDGRKGPFSRFVWRHGFTGPHDTDGDGIVEGVGINLRDGFGWLDEDDDDTNDNYPDEDGNGVNDDTGYYYNEGYVKDPNWVPPTQQGNNRSQES